MLISTPAKPSQPQVLSEKPHQEQRAISRISGPAAISRISGPEAISRVSGPEAIRRISGQQLLWDGEMVVQVVAGGEPPATNHGKPSRNPWESQALELEPQGHWGGGQR